MQNTGSNGVATSPEQLASSNEQGVLSAEGTLGLASPVGFASAADSLVGDTKVEIKGDIIARTVIGLGYEFIETERTGGGTLRVVIDLPYVADKDAEALRPENLGKQPELFVTVQDCERVTRQLQYVLEVEGLDYKRLEVCSPGIDRLLRHEGDLLRFCGEVIDITLKDSVAWQGAARKKFRGQLEAVAEHGSSTWRIVWQDAVAAKPGQKVSAKRLQQAPAYEMVFVWPEIREARLAPLVNFKGRGMQA